MTRRFFITATDTGVGKTGVACALLEELAARGLEPFAFKPYESGGGGDGERLRVAAGGRQAIESVTLHRFEAPLAPGIAAKLERRSPSWRHTLAGFRRLGRGAGVVEGAGGLFVPLDGLHDVIDLIVALDLPVIVVARAGLGTINHTALTLAELARRRQRVAAVVLVKSARTADESERWNRAELERRFPRTRFVGPIPFVAQARRRAEVMRRAVGELTRW